MRFKKKIKKIGGEKKEDEITSPVGGRAGQKRREELGNERGGVFWSEARENKPDGFLAVGQTWQTAFMN